MSGPALVVGIGNRSRGDDGVGPEVAARVAGLDLPGVTVMVCEEPLALVEHVNGYDEVVVVDAVHSGGDVGQVQVRLVGAEPLPRQGHAIGSHGLGVGDAVELARALGRLPHRLTLVGVEAETFLLGAPLSAEVRDHLDAAVRAVTDALTAKKR